MPAPYTPNFHFPSDPSPQRKINDLALQAELGAISDFSLQLLTFLKQLVRDDGSLVDGIVRLRHLHPELHTWLTSTIEGTTPAGLKYLYPVRAVSTNPILNFAGPVTVDTISLQTGDRLLVTAQTDAIQNGVYVINTEGLWTRASDLSAGMVADPSIAIIVSEGETYKFSAWRLVPLHQNPAPQVAYIGTHPIRFTQVFDTVSPLPISRGGTGATSVQAARSNLQAVTAMSFSWIADGTQRIWIFSVGPPAITDATYCTMTIYQEEVKGKNVWSPLNPSLYTAEIKPLSITIRFASAPVANSAFRLVLIGP